MCRHASVGQPTKTYIHQLCVDIGCCLDDLLRAMTNRDGWRERVEGILAVTMPWWWWWWWGGGGCRFIDPNLYTWIQPTFWYLFKSVKHHLNKVENPRKNVYLLCSLHDWCQVETNHFQIKERNILLVDRKFPDIIACFGNFCFQLGNMAAATSWSN